MVLLADTVIPQGFDYILPKTVLLLTSLCGNGPTILFWQPRGLFSDWWLFASCLKFFLLILGTGSSFGFSSKAVLSFQLCGISYLPLKPT